MKKIFFIFILVLIFGCKQANVGNATMRLTSPAFENEGNIPAEHTCDGANAAPPLVIGEVPVGTKSLALIADDPDAPMGTWVHWVVWNIKPDSTIVAGKEGMNDFKKNGYGGPCPPSGTHRYFFKLYALDITLALSDTSTKTDLERVMKGHIIEQVNLVGKYSRG